TSGRGDTGSATWIAATSATATTPKSSKTEKTSPTNPDGTIPEATHPRSRNQREPVATGHGTSIGKLGQVSVRIASWTTENAAAARNAPRESPVSSARPTGRAASSTSGTR